jgi:hypothetical protein
MEKKRGRNATSLAERNPLAFDDNVSFLEQGHVYTVNGANVETSVTGLVKSAFPESASFDGRVVCERNIRRWRMNANNRYHAVVADIPDDDEAIQAILALWDTNRDMGTLTHKAVELTLNGEIVTHDEIIGDVKRELEQYMQWHDRQCLSGWRAVRTELAVYHTRAGKTIAGMIDVLYTDSSTGKYRVVDVKRSKTPLHANAPNYGKWGTGPAAAIKDTDFYRYSLQCWLYSCMLQRLTGKECGAPLLVQIHPDQAGPNAITCADLKDVAEQLLDGDEPSSALNNTERGGRASK